MATHSSTLAWKVPWTEEPGRLTRRVFTFTFHFHALEKEMATHSSVLAWRIPGTGEPGGLLSMGSHRVGHDWNDLAAAAAVFSLYVCMHMLGSAPAQDYLIFSALWAYSYHQIWKKSLLLVWGFSTMGVWNANVWSPCVTSDFSSLPFSNRSLPSLICNITCTQVVWYSVEMSWRSLCTFLEVFFAWLPDPELIYHDDIFHLP